MNFTSNFYVAQQMDKSKGEPGEQKQTPSALPFLTRLKFYATLSSMIASDRKEIAVRVFRVYNGQAIIGHVGVPATSRDVLSEAERKADANYGLWDRLEEVEYVD
jgi:hypothetical protein